MGKHLKYLSYVVRHKYFVFLAGLKTRAPIWRLVIHDWSKFSPREWNPYAIYFYAPHHAYGSKERKSCEACCRMEEQFNHAWLHHQHCSPHHYQHWILRNDSGDIDYLKMPSPLVREMVADWMGAGRAITGKWDVKGWYIKNRDLIAIHPESRALVEHLIGLD